jgi:hypothetical protein
LARCSSEASPIFQRPKGPMYRRPPLPPRSRGRSPRESLGGGQGAPRSAKPLWQGRFRSKRPLEPLTARERRFGAARANRLEREKPPTLCTISHLVTHSCGFAAILRGKLAEMAGFGVVERLRKEMKMLIEFRVENHRSLRDE